MKLLAFGPSDKLETVVVGELGSAITPVPDATVQNPETSGSGLIAERVAVLTPQTN